jgi:chromosome segregation ATPase
MKKETKKKEVNIVEVKITPEIRALFDSYHKETEIEMKRHVGALSEEHQTRTSAVAEQYSGLVEKVDSIKKTLDSHTEMIGVIMEDVSVLKDDVAVLKKDVAEIKEDLKTKADKTEVVHLSRRVAVLEHTS